MTALDLRAMPTAATGAPPLRILMVAARYFPFSGGIETHIHEVGTRLAAEGSNVTVLTADPNGTLPVEEDVAGMRVRRVRARPAGTDWCFAPDIYRQLTDPALRPDVVHVQGYHTFSAPLGMMGAIRARIPFVLTFHSGGHSSAVRRVIRSPQGVMLAPLARRAALLIGVSRFEADHFSRLMRIPRERFAVVPNGAGLPAVAGAIARKGGPLIVSLGRLERYKGHHRALAAFAHLRKSHPDARLRILGTGPYEGELRAMVSRLGLEEAVEIGGIPPESRGEMAATLASAALVVLLSDYEAHPIAVIEALSLGRRVVTTDTSGFRELAEDGLVRAVPLDAAAGDVASVMAAEIDRADAALSPIALSGWDECAGRLAALYGVVARRQG